jgi:hypothetical protein
MVVAGPEEAGTVGGVVTKEGVLAIASCPLWTGSQKKLMQEVAFSCDHHVTS